MKRKIYSKEMFLLDKGKRSPITDGVYMFSNKLLANN